MTRPDSGLWVRLGCLAVTLGVLFFLVWANREWILEVRTSDAGARVLCEPLNAQSDIVYRSINSIYNDPVEETWHVQPDGSFAVTEVRTSPAVMGYYGIPVFERTDGPLVRAKPEHVVYDEIRMLVDARGQASLALNGHAFVLYRMVPEATVVTIHARPALRYFGCW